MQELKLLNGNTKLFTNNTDYLNYIDYLQNGLKCIKQNGSSYHFNNGAKMFEIKDMITNKCNYIVEVDGKKYTNVKFTSKYVKVANIWSIQNLKKMYYIA